MAFDQLKHSANFDPAGDFEAFLSAVPAKWVVYLFAGADDRPVQLLCVRNLRASLRRRLGQDAEQIASKRVDYRQIVQRIHWQRVDSEFEADLLYLELARTFFPATYRQLVSSRPSWFVHIDPAAEFPRYVKTTDLSEKTGAYFGPLEDKAHAAKLIEQIEDWFDLCRYHNILVQSPGGKACAYKQMGRCPAPCDGSISVSGYLNLIDLSIAALTDPPDYIRWQQLRMQQAATELKFEAALKIRQYLESLSALGKGSYRHLRRLRDFRFLSVQRGPSAKVAKICLITPTRIEPIGCLLEEPAAATGLIRDALSRAEELVALPIDAHREERVAIVSRHLFAAKAAGVFIPLDRLDERALLAAYKETRKQKVVDETEDEGIVREAVSP
jgi:excinuclease UvrABC nuclease subunit